MQPLSLSIVIPSRHRADLLQLCLNSVSLHAPPETEIIVVDDGSSESKVSHVASTFSNVKVLRFDQPFGFCVAANTGISHAKGDIIELLNDDTEVTAGWANTALSAFENPVVGVVAPLVLQGPPHDGPPIIDSAGDIYHAGGFARKRGRGLLVEGEFLRPGFVFGASGSSAFYRRNILQRVGVFPEDFGAYFEDVDLSWRINHAGFRCWYEPSSIVWHRVSSSYHKADRRLLEMQSLNEERVFWRNIPGPIWQKIPLHLAVLLAKACRRMSEGNLLPFLRGRFRILSEFRSLIKQRERNKHLASHSGELAPEK